MRVLDAYPWIRDRFAGLAEQAGGRYCSATCPVVCHQTAQLRFWIGDDGRLMFGCWGGCAKLEILRAVGATWKDCFPGGEMPARVRQEIVARYPYRDECGTLLYETVRLEPGTRSRDKDFRQRRPRGRDCGDGWEWSLGDVRRVLYRLPELLAASPSETVFVVAGEKDVESLQSIGLVATTNVCGERSPWLVDYSRSLTGRYVVVIPDADEPGRRHANEVAGSLLDYAAGVRKAEVPAKDATAYLSLLRRAGVSDRAALREGLWEAVSESTCWVKES